MGTTKIMDKAKAKEQVEPPAVEVKVVELDKAPMETNPIEVKAPEAEKKEKGAGAKAQWADPEKRARLKFGMKRWSSCGKPKKGTPEYDANLKETKHLLATGEWKNVKFPEAVKDAKKV
jgi:hypothetical protein